jgi:PAS domain-containing protein
MAEKPTYEELEKRVKEFEKDAIDRKKSEDEVICKNIFDDSGDPTLQIGVIRDISERKQAVDKLKESEETFKKLFDLSPLPISVTDMETGRIIDVNTKLCEFTESIREELLGRTATELEFYSEHDRERFIRELSVSGGCSFSRLPYNYVLSPYVGRSAAFLLFKK